MAGALLMTAMLAQALTSAPEDTGDLDRIRRALAEEPAITIPMPVKREGFVFRVTVKAPWPEKPMWEDWSNVPSYIRPNMPLYHYDFLYQVTPQDFRAGTLYSVGIPVGALIELLAKHIKVAHHKSQEEHAREEVRQALAELLACRADPSRPGC